MSERPMHAIPGAFQKLQGLYSEGVEALEQHDFETAVSKFDEGIALDDHFRHMYVTMYTHRGRALMGLGRFDEAAADLGKALEMEPEPHYANLHFQRGFAYDKAGNAEAALRDFDASIALYQDYAGPFHMRGRLHLQAGRYGEAIRDFDRVLELQPSQEATRLRQEAVTKGAHQAQETVGTGTLDADPVVFPGQKLAKLSDYVAFTKRLQTGDMMGALSAYGLDMMSYGAVAQAWAAKLGGDPVLTAQFARLMSGG
ncbi:MAG TPA: tetratricopeptide repeat protein [Polyangiaceae bacterium]|nr:tetratricopeptide repeat protein [Polyangiaceae bacterium]